jgi:glycosyltransferase involved in cell wall biosynthesis
MDEEVMSFSARGPAAPPAPPGPLRVLFLSDHLGHPNDRIHGVTTYFLETLPAFDQTQIAPMLCILQPRHAVAARFEAAGVELIFLDRNKWDPRAFIDLLDLLRRRRVDVLHISGEKSLLLGRTVARWRRLPVVAHFHDALPGLRLLRPPQRRLAPHTDLALAVSEPIRAFAIREFGIPPGQAQVLHNGLRLERFARPAAGARWRLRAELGLDPDTPTVALIGRVHPAKGQRCLIRALPRLLERCPEAIGVIVGDGPDREACIALARELGVGERVRFTGQRDDIPDVLAAVDVVAVPSLWEEPFPFVALEAMAAGRPVVAFRIGGLPESIVHGETGFLVAHADENGFADALAEILTRPELAQRLGQGASRRAQEFTIEQHVQRLQEIYASIQREHAARAYPARVLPPPRTSEFPLAGSRGGRRW